MDMLHQVITPGAALGERNAAVFSIIKQHGHIFHNSNKYRSIQAGAKNSQLTPAQKGGNGGYLSVKA